MEWEKIEVVFRDIFARKWFTNHGPLVQQLEAVLARENASRHAICMTNTFIAQKIATRAGGGCVVELIDGAVVYTEDDNLAAKLRNMRSSYGAGPVVEVPLTGNGRMSEAQAALALLDLGEL